MAKRGREIFYTLLIYSNPSTLSQALPVVLAVEEFHDPAAAAADPHAEPANRIVVLDLAAGTNRIVVR